MNDNNVKVVYTFEYSKPIKVTDFTNSLGSFDQQYSRYLKKQNSGVTDTNIRFCIQDIRKGSIVADLIPLYGYLLAYPDGTLSIFEYLKNLKEMFEFLQGITAKPPFHLERADLQHAKNIVKPIANDYGSQLIVTATDNANVQVYNYQIKPPEAVDVIEGAKQQEKLLDKPATEYFQSQLLYFRNPNG